MTQVIVGRLLPPVPYKQMCDLVAPGHNRIILPNRPRYQVATGIARGKFHGRQCYEVARKQYEQAKKEELLREEARSM